MSESLGTVAGIEIFKNREYKVDFEYGLPGGYTRHPAHNGATWVFTHKGRDGTVHGSIVDHPVWAVRQRWTKVQDLCISPDAFKGRISPLFNDSLKHAKHAKSENGWVSHEDRLAQAEALLAEALELVKQVRAEV